MNSKRKGFSGFSLVELLIGMTVMIVVAMAIVRTLQITSRSQNQSDELSRLNIAMQSVADYYRQLAAVNFSNMQWPDRQEYSDGTSQKGIKVLGQVGVVKSDRTRTAIISGFKYENGVMVSSKTLTMELTQIRGKEFGAVIYIEVRNKKTNNPIPGVYLTTQGQDQAEVTAYTNLLGRGELRNVLISNAGVTVKVDGETVTTGNGGPCYFDDINPKNFQKNYTTGATAAGAIIDLTGNPNGPYKMVCAGVLVGTITHANTNVGIPNYTVFAYPKSGSLEVPRSVGRQTAVTNGDGIYTIRGLIPGMYAVYPIETTNGQYPALAQPNDKYTNTSYPGFVRVSSDSTSFVNFQSLPMGSITGNVYLVTGWDNVNKRFTNASVAATNPTLSLSGDQSLLSHGLTTITTFNMDNTTAWDQDVQYETSATGGVTIGPTGSSSYSYNYYAPRIAHKDNITRPLSEQFTNVRVRSAFTQTVPNGTPIVVVNPLTQPVVNIRTGTSTSYNSFRILPMSSPSETFNTKMFLNQTVTKDIYIMHKNMLCQISGVINLANIPFTLGGKVIVGLGDFANVGGVNISGNNSSMETTYTSNVALVTGAYNTGKFIVPNFSDADTTLVRFKYKENLPLVSKTLTAYASSYTKIYSNGSLSRPNIEATDLTNLQLEFYREDETSSPAFTISNVDVVSRFINKSISQIATFNQYAASATINLVPGQDYTVNMNIPAPEPSTYQKYDIRAVPPNGSRWQFTWAFGTKGPRFSYDPVLDKYKQFNEYGFVFNRILKGTIFGTITHQSTAKDGIKVRLYRSGFSALPSDSTYIESVLDNDACAADQQFCFQNFDFSAADGSNFTLEVYDPTGVYNTVVESRQGYDNYNAPWNIALTLRPVVVYEGP